MKQLLACVALLFVIGIAGFLYRNTMERPGSLVPDVACTMEARICPDGTSVGRSGPSCAFASCALPNIEIASAGISFVIPSGYALSEDASVLALFAKPSASGNPPHVIEIRSLAIAEGKTADEVILANTRYQPSDIQAEDFERFEDLTLGGKTFRETVIERFEGQVHTAYFLVREQDVLRFEVRERDVTAWTDPALDIRTLPEHRALHALLASLQARP